jgi:hypothetical protein
LAPDLTRVAFVRNPDNQFDDEVLKILQRTAPKIGCVIEPVEMGKPQDIANGFARQYLRDANTLKLEV